MRKYSLQELKDEFCKHLYNWDEFHLIGIRSKADQPDVFDDMLYVVSDSDKLHCFNHFTTNPGRYWLENPIHEKGAAVLMPGQYHNLWQFGLHQRKYEALVQANPVTVYRDNDLDENSEEYGHIETGYFGINFHRANANVKSIINGKWSAGCQVMADPEEFEKVLELCDLSGLKYFTYTLIKQF